jgi:hypothetical protein
MAKLANFDEKLEYVLGNSQKSQLGHKRLNKQYELNDSEYVLKKDYYFVIDAKIQINFL